MSQLASFVPSTSNIASRSLVSIGLVLASSCASSFALAAEPMVDVASAWARTTVKGQTASVVYMTLTSTTSARLVGASSPVAAVVQVHEMAIQGTTMKMRPVAALDLPPGKPVELKVGGPHVMLQDLRQQLASGDKVPLILRIEGPDHRIVEQAISVDVRNAAPMMTVR